MPYIKKEDRKIVDKYIFDLLIYITDHGMLNKTELSVGAYNYIISRIVHQFLIVNGLNYTNINAMMGVLECSKLELYRIIAAPYEDKKILENGTISTLDKKNEKE